MLSRLYANWMFAWETALTTRDTNRIVRPLEWGFDWLEPEARSPSITPSPSGASGELSGQPSEAGAPSMTVSPSWVGSPGEPSGQSRSPSMTASPPWAESTDPTPATETPSPIDRMIALNDHLVAHADRFFSYTTPNDFRLERRHPQLFPTNVRPETLAQDADLQRRAIAGKLPEAEFLRFTSPIRTRYPENDTVNARWYPANLVKQKDKPKQAIIVMPQWNADAFSHNALCTLFNRFGISALRLSKPYHDIRRPAELERSDYAVSANIGRTVAACRQAVVDIRCCLDWLESEGYTQFGVLGTSLGSCYAFIAAAMDPRLRVCAFNHASTWFGDVIWTGQSTRHIRTAFEQADLTQDLIRQLFTSISPMSYMRQFAANPKRCLVVHATYDLTFLRQFSLDVLHNLNHFNVDYVSRVLPCGHYTTGETPYKFLDGFYLATFIHNAFRQLARDTKA